MSQLNSLEIRRAEAEKAITRFLANSRSTQDRAFWIYRTQRVLGLTYCIAPKLDLLLTSETMRDLSMATCPFLAVAAMHWAQEFYCVNDIPSKEELQNWYSKYSRQALGEGWEPRSAREQKVKPKRVQAPDPTF